MLKSINGALKASLLGGNSVELPHNKKICYPHEVTDFLYCNY